MGSPYLRSTDTALLHPAFRAAAQAVLAQLNAAGHPFRLFEAFRTPERQTDLYAQGRSKPGAIVTYQPPWRSYHQYGLAADFVLYVNGTWSWDASAANAPAWDALKTIGAAHQLDHLAFEKPHLQLSGTSIDALAAGVYPPGGDDSWAENLAVVIRTWGGSPPAPQPPHTPQRPPL